MVRLMIISVLFTFCMGRTYARHNDENFEYARCEVHFSRAPIMGCNAPARTFHGSAWADRRDHAMEDACANACEKCLKHADRYNCTISSGPLSSPGGFCSGPSSANC